MTRAPPYDLAELAEIWATHRDVLQSYWPDDTCCDFTTSPVSGLIPVWGCAVMYIYWTAYTRCGAGTQCPPLRAVFLAFYAAPYDNAHWFMRFRDGAPSAEWIAEIIQALLHDDALEALAYYELTANMLRGHLLTPLCARHSQFGSSS